MVKHIYQYPYKQLSTYILKKCLQNSDQQKLGFKPNGITMMSDIVSNYNTVMHC